MQSSINSLRDPTLQVEENITLYSAPGSVASVADFAEENLHLLNSVEQSVVRSQLHALVRRDGCRLEVPLSRSPAISTGELEVKARRHGARSALLPGGLLKLKGCRPEPGTFPDWYCNEFFQLKVRKLPFGIMTAEAVMREILGYLFFRLHGLPVSAIPNTVVTYSCPNHLGTCALLFTITSDQRIESFLDARGMTLHRLIRLNRFRRRSDELGREIGLSGIDRAHYVDRKVRQLVKCNLLGGFRGILNSNIGNDVVCRNVFVSLCDFDSFFLIPVPQVGDSDGIRRIVFNSMFELIKTSLPIIDFIAESDANDLRISLMKCYQATSTVYREYVRYLLKYTEYMGWVGSYIRRLIQEAMETDLAFELLQELIPNFHTLRTFTLDSWYVPHS
jgi:hypothetical protein